MTSCPGGPQAVVRSDYLDEGDAGEGATQAASVDGASEAPRQPGRPRRLKHLIDQRAGAPGRRLAAQNRDQEAAPGAGLRRLAGGLFEVRVPESKPLSPQRAGHLTRSRRFAKVPT
jgi:hypothetical protein